MPPAEKRTWNRLAPADNHVTLKTPHGSSLAEVVDVSFGGAALKVTRHCPLQQNDLVDVQWRGTWMRGLVRHLVETENEIRLGIEWANSR